MNKIKKLINYFSPLEITIWGASVILITASFLIFDRSGFLSLAASLVGVSALILCAKGNPAGQVLMIVFCILYGIISWSFSYYGEMITYVFMSLPMAIAAFISWVRNPFEKGKPEVAVNRISARDVVLMLVLAVIVTVLFYFILKYFGTANLVVSTLSITTSFAAVFLTYKRSPYFALAYAFNDIVLMILWGLACFEDISYISVLVCFIAFLANDIYTFASWQKMKTRQLQSNAPSLD